MYSITSKRHAKTLQNWNNSFQLKKRNIYESTTWNPVPQTQQNLSGLKLSSFWTTKAASSATPSLFKYEIPWLTYFFFPFKSPASPQKNIWSHYILMTKDKWKSWINWNEHKAMFKIIDLDIWSRSTIRICLPHSYPCSS